MKKVGVLCFWFWPLWVVAVILLAGCSATVTGPGSSSSGAPTAEAQSNSTSLSTNEQPGAQANAPRESCADIPGACVTENLLATVVQYLTFFAELCGALIIAVGVIRAVIKFLPHIFGRDHDDNYKENLRFQLGKSLALALEFELGADILKTAVAPTWTIIAQLAAIIVLRTLLNYFLEQELRQAEQRRAGEHLATSRNTTEGQPPVEVVYNDARNKPATRR